MKNKQSLLIRNRWWILVIAAVIVVIVFLGSKKGNIGLINPNPGQQSAKQTEELPIATPNAPKQYNFDSSTDLKKELDSINPQVLESDFE